MGWMSFDESGDEHGRVEDLPSPAATPELSKALLAIVPDRGRQVTHRLPRRDQDSVDLLEENASMSRKEPESLVRDILLAILERLPKDTPRCHQKRLVTIVPRSEIAD